jgi:hypothetical protein
MDKTAGPTMMLCPKCKTIQKAGEACPNCTYPIPFPKDKPQEDDTPKKANDHLAKSLHLIKSAIEE